MFEEKLICINFYESRYSKKFRFIYKLTKKYLDIPGYYMYEYR